MRRDKISVPAKAAIASLFFVVVAASPVAAQAQPATLGQVVDNARGWVMGLLAGVATLFFVIGGARYVMARR